MKLKSHLTTITLTIPLIAPFTAWGDDDEWEHRRSYPQPSPLLEQYREECGSCHMAYPPRFLGEASWQRIMHSLQDHFGENAELEPQEQQALLRFLSENSGPSRWYRFWKKSDEVPIRITQTRAFRHEHDEIPRHLIRKNPKIESLSQCERCHTRATEGSFSEYQIRIPGFGRWEDD